MRVQVKLIRIIIMCTLEGASAPEERVALMVRSSESCSCLDIVNYRQGSLSLSLLLWGQGLSSSPISFQSLPPRIRPLLSDYLESLIPWYLCGVS